MIARNTSFAGPPKNGLFKRSGLQISTNKTGEIAGVTPPTGHAAPALSGRAPSKKMAGSAASIFDQDWWLDAAAPGAWDRVTIAWDGETVGEMSFHATKRWGLTYIKMPH